MPYIKKEKRNKWLKVIQGKVELKFDIATAGELNYVITQACLAYLDHLSCYQNDQRKVGNNYTDYNAVIGALECAKQEFYRRMIAPYEDKKKKENGDVY